jgi:hypothetical protein
MNIETKSEISKNRREYRKENPNGRVPGKLDEHDRAVIKEYCRLVDTPINSTIDLSKNLCVLRSKEKYFFIGTIQKVVFKDIFILLSQFKLFTSRDNKDKSKVQIKLLQPGTELFVDNEDPTYFNVEVDGSYIKVPRFVFVKSALIRQKYGLFITNPDCNFGFAEGQRKVDIVQFVTDYSKVKIHQHVLLK